ncbi:MAG: hypothetical protein KF722_04445 [Nitrospira sp.]|nr:hypothetical protein [Nitrospira sp.]
MSRAAHLMIEAKKAITDEQIHRFLSLTREERWEEAAKQIGVTLACVADLLEEGAQTLQALEPPAIQRPQMVPQEIEASGGESREPLSGSCEA